MKYRAEIDGLRALAVIPVILFHAGFDLFSGGFVGVDVFFVISGYLITTILIEDFENNRFSLGHFYERRARRILPALFLVTLVCIPFAWVWMLPEQMRDFSQSIVAVSLFASNFLFWQENDYFELESEEKPLLHTWSLAVEEQYYVLFPIFLLLVWRFGKNRVFWSIVIMATLSLLFSEWGSRRDASATFFLAHTRAWELFAGSIAAFVVQKKGVQSNNMLSLLGLCAILFAIFAYDKATPFPSFYALVPVTGVVFLVLFGGTSTFTARLLSLKICVGIGLISYSAYLWHQPIFAFTRIISHDTPAHWLMALLSLFAFALAFLSWKFVEKPFRNRTFLNGSRVFLFSLIGMFAFIIIGTSGHLTQGFNGRLTPQEIVFEKQLYNSPTPAFKAALKRKKFAEGTQKKLLIIGDSYAKDFLEAMTNAYQTDIDTIDIVFLHIPRRCKNVLSDTPNLLEHLQDSDTHCFKSTNRIGQPKWDQLITQADLVIVRSYWDELPTYEMPRTYDYANALNPGKVIFIGSQFFGKDLPYKNLVGLKKIDAPTYSYGLDQVKSYSKNVDAANMLNLVKHAKDAMKERNYFDVFDYFCDAERCLVVNQNKQPLTNDLKHLTSIGEKLMMEKLFQNDDFSSIWKNTIGLLPFSN